MTKEALHRLLKEADSCKLQGMDNVKTLEGLHLARGMVKGIEEAYIFISENLREKKEIEEDERENT